MSTKRKTKTTAALASDWQHTTPEAALEEGPLKELLGYQLAQAYSVTAKAFLATVSKPYDLNTVEYTMLTLILNNPGVSPAKLCKALGISKPYVTARLEKLHSRALIIRQVNQKDRRAQHLYVTDEATEMLAKTMASLAASEREHISTLTQAELSILIELLHKLSFSRN